MHKNATAGAGDSGDRQGILAELNALAINQNARNVEIIVAPVGRGRFSASCAGRVIVEASRQPLLDAARVLAGEGADPRSRIAMRHAGAEHIALRSTVGRAARLTVTEPDRGRPTLVPWEPFRSPAVPSPLGFLRDPYPWRGEPHPALGWLVLPARRAAR